ncbi:hypothetical protein AB0K18_38590 [Nonomuraea sp. NPDC049421]|uniref:hypothetical protein n=1 Tax=Nonomuraea sp. NPDC049421 TaxID=3155275 RepID=UPI00343F90FD
MGKLKKTAAVAFGLAAALAGTIATSGPAMAADTPIAACGGGSYHVIDSHALGSSAVVYLLYNGSTNCVVTWKTGARGNSTWVEARVRHDHMYFNVDEGNFKYYAGPAKATGAAGSCIMWGGSYGSQSYLSGWEHCG